MGTQRHTLREGRAPTTGPRHFDPTHVLGCTPEQAMQLFRGRPVTPGEAEAIAEQSYDWRRHVHDPDSYWVTTGQAATILRMSPRQVQRLLDLQQLPYVDHASGVRLMRRAQIEALAQRYVSGRRRSGSGTGRSIPGAR